jgi:hypothetical protein
MASKKRSSASLRIKIVGVCPGPARRKSELGACVEVGAAETCAPMRQNPSGGPLRESTRERQVRTSPRFYVSTLRRSLQLTGSVDELSKRLKVTDEQIYLWMLGTQPISEETFLKIVDLLADEIVKNLP